MAEDVEIKLKNVRLSFFHGFVPQDRRDDKTKELTGYNYNTSVLVPKTETAVIEQIKAAMKAAKDAAWGNSPPTLQADQLCLRDGEPADMDGNRQPLYDGYSGCLYVSANRPVKIEDYEAIKAGRKRRPVRIIGPRKNPETQRFDELDENDQFAPYSGCFANVILRIYGYVPPQGSSQRPRINASLEAVQFVKDGERFGARSVDVDSAFDEEEVTADDMGGGSAPAAAADGFDIG